jgi:hypothetical protein
MMLLHDLNVGDLVIIGKSSLYSGVNLRDEIDFSLKNSKFVNRKSIGIIIEIAKRYGQWWFKLAFSDCLTGCHVIGWTLISDDQMLVKVEMT